MEIGTKRSAADPELPHSSSPGLPPSQLFFGPHGLRAGWCLAVYGSIYYILRFVVFVAAAPLSGPRGKLPPLWAFLVNEFFVLLIAVVPALFMSRVENRPFRTYGLPPHAAFRKNFWTGVIWGFLAFTVLIAAMRGMGLVSFHGLALHGVRVLKFAGFWGVMFLAVGLREEFLFRGYSLYTLSDGIGFWPAVALLSACFGYVHRGNPGEGWVGLLGVVTIGLFFCLTLRRTGTLWFAVGMHAAWDWSETFFYSVPDSGLVLPGHLLKTSFHGPAWLTGGSVGPEGSALLFVLIALLWVVFDRLYPHKAYPPEDLIATKPRIHEPAASPEQQSLG
jgi:membrane protease YdiL (CAAX protease family)